MTDALTRLADAVEAGMATEADFDAAWPHAINGEHHYAKTAYNGSLDAAKALHEAVLPERYGVALQYSGRYAAKAIICDPMDGTNWQSGNEWIDPARAWLLAIILALAQVQK